MGLSARRGRGAADALRADALPALRERAVRDGVPAVSYTHLRAHETVLDIVCRLLLEKKNKLDGIGIQAHR